MKIFITGDSGAGKSTLAIALKEKLGIPVFHADLYRFKDEYTMHPYDEFKNKIQSIISENQSYILDGCEFGDDPEVFIKVLNDADIVINFDVSPRLAISGFFNRVFNYKEKNMQPSATGNVGESESVEYFKIWLDFYYSRLHVKTQREPLFKKVSKKVRTVRNHQESDNLLAELVETYAAAT